MSTLVAVFAAGTVSTGCVMCKADRLDHLCGKQWPSQYSTGRKLESGGPLSLEICFCALAPAVL
jgi:hypothetical protein